MRTFEARTPVDKYYLSYQKKNRAPSNAQYPYHLLEKEDVDARLQEVRHHIEQWNTGHLERLIYAFSRALSGYDSSKFCVCITGSHGRREAYPKNQGDLFILVYDDEVGKRLQKYFLNKPGFLSGLDIDEKIEVKVLLDEDHFISGYQGDRHQYWPDRIISAQVIAGSYGMYQDALKQVEHEFENTREFKQQIRNQMNRFRRLTAEGVDSKGGVHFNPHTGELFYDSERYIKGFKYGPLRLVQTHTTKEQVKNGVVEFDTSMLERIRCVQENNEDTELLVSIYTYVLTVYHYQLFQFNNNQQSRILIDPSTLQEIQHHVLKCT